MDFSNWKTDKLIALHRCCKTKAHAFFRDPYLTIALRKEMDKRKLAQQKAVKGIRRRKRTV